MSLPRRARRDPSTLAGASAATTQPPWAWPAGDRRAVPGARWKPLAEGMALVIAAGALIALASQPTASSVLAFGAAVVAYALASFALSDA